MPLTETGIAAGTRVMTLDGALPVEFLCPGDRIVTRAGAKALRSVGVRTVSGTALRVAGGALGHDRPERALLAGAGARVLLRDWRAKALHGQAQAVVPLARLADGEFVAPVAVEGLRMFALHFDAPQVIYAEGVELAAEPATAPVPA